MCQWTVFYAEIFMWCNSCLSYRHSQLSFTKLSPPSLKFNTIFFVIVLPSLQKFPWRPFVQFTARLCISFSFLKHCVHSILFFFFPILLYSLGAYFYLVSDFAIIRVCQHSASQGPTVSQPGPAPGRHFPRHEVRSLLRPQGRFRRLQIPIQRLRRMRLERRVCDFLLLIFTRISSQSSTMGKTALEDIFFLQIFIFIGSNEHSLSLLDTHAFQSTIFWAIEYFCKCRREINPEHTIKAGGKSSI